MQRAPAVLVLLALLAAPATAQDPRPKEPVSKPEPASAKEADAGTPASAEGRKMGLARPLVFTEEREVYGARLKGLRPVPLPEIKAAPKTWDGKEVQVRGRITGVCPKKGCWMMVEDGRQTVRVRFTDYAFFVPLDCTGRKVAAEGRVTVRLETEAERRHYAEDRGLPPEEIAKIQGDRVVLSFEADAVQMGTLPPPPEPEEEAEKEDPGGGKKPDRPKEDGSSGQA